MNFKTNNSNCSGMDPFLEDIEKNYAKIFASRFKKAMNENQVFPSGNDVSVYAIAEYLHASPSTVYNYGAGSSFPSVEKLLKLANYMFVPLDYFFDREHLFEKPFVITKRLKYEILCELISNDDISIVMNNGKATIEISNDELALFLQKCNSNYKVTKENNMLDMYEAWKKSALAEIPDK